MIKEIELHNIKKIPAAIQNCVLIVLWLILFCTLHLHLNISILFCYIIVTSILEQKKKKINLSDC